MNRRSLLAKLTAFVPLSLLPVSLRSSAEVGEQAQDGPMMALGYLSRLLPDSYIHGKSPMALAHDIADHVNVIADDAERREVSLAGVSAAAHGATGALNTAQRDDWAWHPAYQDVLDLRRKFDAALRILTERIPTGQQIMLYPCGCSAIANLPDGKFLPFECGCGAPSGATSIVINPHRTPTIEELEAILAQGGNGPAFTVLPNGQVIA